MASSTDICNLALSHLGDDGQITSLSPPDGSVQASYSARFYPLARRSLLEMFEWPFAAMRATDLSELTVGDEYPEWAFAYSLPSDCVKVRQIMAEGSIDPLDAEDFLVEGQTLYTNAENPTLRYTRDVTDTTKFSALFVDTFSYLMASRLAGPLTKDPAKVKAFYDIAIGMGRAAGASAANAAESSTSNSPAVWMTDR